MSEESRSGMVRAEQVRAELVRAEQVRSEARRLTRRLDAARQRLDAVASPRDSSHPRAVSAYAHEISDAYAAVARGCGDGTGEEARIDDVDDEARALLQPAVDRVAKLAGLARALADGTLSEAAVEDAVRALTAVQPVRRPR